ncbi:hypothetical protein LCGC14_2253510 [marine sediment metagenome]|uniref:Uncharacterized protein n=1 Tax=marine sediment metagenome TaxID=412755 RepID=A0A0F9D253_9ZZZZ
MPKGISEMAMIYSDDVRRLNPGLAKEVQTKPASKYHNARAEAKGLRFQSGHEAVEIGKLIIAEEHKKIFALRLQVKFPLQGKNAYIADAVYLDEDLELHIVDVKGFETPEFKIKAKLFKEKYGRGIEILR